MWSFFILSLQAMIIIAWNGSGNLGSVFEGKVFKRVLSIFITAALLKLAQAIIDLVMMWKARFSMSFHVKLRYVLKTLSAAAWVIILPVTYSFSLDNPSGFGNTMKNWFGSGSSSPSVFILAIVIYLSPNIISALLFLLPFVRRHLERSDFRIVRLIMWWSQLPLYIGRGMHEDPLSLIKYTFFWVALIVAKLAFSFYLEIKPLVGPLCRQPLLNWKITPNKLSEGQYILQSDKRLLHCLKTSIDALDELHIAKNSFLDLGAFPDDAHVADTLMNIWAELYGDGKDAHTEIENYNGARWACS